MRAKRTAQDPRILSAAPLILPMREPGSSPPHDAERELSTLASRFGPSEMGSLPPLAPAGPFAAGANAGSVFDVCHVGVVMRATAFVEGAMALAALVIANGRDPLWLVSLGLLIGLPAVLLWLVLMCGMRRLLTQLGVPLQAAVAMLAGALCAWAGRGLVALVPSPLPDDTAGISLLVGAAFAGLLYYWLRLRSRAQFPADTAARLVELQARIRPHFLFNTLNTAVALVRVDPERAEAVLEDLAELFRVALADSGTSVSLADEVQLAQRYLAIEQIRYGTRLRIEWELDERAGQARVPPLVLQPLIENAVRHGIDPSPDGGSIQVRTHCRRGRAVVDIVNSVPDAPSQPGHGMALDNVRERLRLLHDVAAQFSVQRDAQRFRVRMAVPL